MNAIKKRITFWVLSILLILDVAYLVYCFQNPAQEKNTMLGILFLGLLVGALVVYLVKNDKVSKTPHLVKESSHTVLQSMQKVFKVVTAEGVFNEIYDYSHTKKIWKILPSTKKALVIAKGKVQMGYDFAECEWEVDEESKQLKLIKFPEPKIISLESDFEYYNLEEKFYDLFSKEDLANIHREAKKQIKKAAYQSQLPATAAEQIEVVIKELALAKGWRLENTALIHAPQQKSLPGE